MLRSVVVVRSTDPAGELTVVAETRGDCMWDLTVLCVGSVLDEAAVRR
jgi:hypothetical protein